jgi:hypothetical protein
MIRTKYKLFTLVIALSAVGCTKNFEALNTNPAAVTESTFLADFKAVSLPLQNALRNQQHFVNWQYQLQLNLNADIYSGYMMTPTAFNGGNNNSNYFMMDGWNEAIMNIAYDGVMQALYDYDQKKLEYSGINFDDTDAMALLLRVTQMHRISDVFGPIIYTNFAKPNADLSVDFDSQEDAYKAFFKDLDDAVSKLEPYAAGTKSVTTAFKSADLVYEGNAGKWLRYANSLRLRLALRIVYANPTLAKAEGEKALAHPAGLTSSNADNFLIKLGSESPVVVISEDWSDIRMGAPFTSLLNGYSDPRITKMVSPASDAAVTGQFIGIRNGVNIDDKSRYSGFSKPLALASAGNYFDRVKGLQKMMCASEVLFMRAEAALRGWTGAGNAATLYEEAVKASFEEWGASNAEGYLTDNTATAEPYVDPKSVVAGINNVLTGNANLSTVTIAWSNADTDERKLERIITQKWIAMYPNSLEAWSEFRRTGYPKLFPVVENKSNGETTGFIKRLPIPNKFKNVNPQGYQRMLTSLGTDVSGTRLWWDQKP